MFIDQLITQPESKTLEFKRDLSSPKPLLKSLVAFANTAGGRLVIGVADDQEILGIENPLDEEEILSSLIADSISPRLVPNIKRLTIEEMKQGTSRIRNHVIARVFRETHLIEQWGTGIRRIFQEAKDQNLPEPEIREVGMRLRFTIYLENPIIVPLRAQSGAQSDLLTGQVVKGAQIRPESRPESETEKKIMEVLLHKPLGRMDIALSLGINRFRDRSNELLNNYKKKVSSNTPFQKNPIADSKNIS